MIDATQVSRPELRDRHSGFAWSRLNGTGLALVAGVWVSPPIKEFTELPLLIQALFSSTWVMLHSDSIDFIVQSRSTTRRT